MDHRVLVVEDDPTIREVLVEVLGEHGYQAVGASNGREALETLASSSDRPCVILLDLMMPIMDGRSFREEQMQQPDLSGIPVIVISAHLDHAVTADLHAAAYLRKPVKLADVLQQIREYCDPRGSADPSVG
jgi:CheY-like chemotaxis protein